MKRKKNKQLTDSPSWYQDLERRYIEIMMKKNEIEHELLEIREELLSCMKDDNIDKIITKLTEVYVIHEYDGRRVDGTKLKNEMPEIFAQYSKPYKMSEHLQVTINKDNKLND